VEILHDRAHLDLEPLPEHLEGPVLRPARLVRHLSPERGLDLKAPNHTTLSRRNQTVEVPLLTRAHDGPIYLVVDSTGLKILGSGEWNEHKYKALGKRRDWRKLHIGVDDEGWDSGPIRAGVESCNNVTLMINGRYDMLLPLEESIRPMFDLLGTPPPEHKELLLFDTDHIPPRNEFIKGTLSWLDRYLGPVM